MRTGLLVIGLSILLFSCKSKGKVPSNILPQQKMQLVMWDLMRADQFLADYVLNRDSTKKKIPESLRYYQEIFAIHKITRDEFQRSFSFYQSRPDLLKAIMDSIAAPQSEAPTQVVQPDAIPRQEAQPDTGIQVPVEKRILNDTLSRRKRQPVID